MDTIWALAREGQLDELLRYVPDSVVDGADELRPSAESGTPLSFLDVVTHGFEIRGFTFDSFGERHLYHCPPAPSCVTRLSCFRTAPDRCVLRYAVAAEGGERSVLTFGMECREMLAPHYRSARIDYVWQLVSVTGEAAAGAGAAAEEAAEPGEHPQRPHPSVPPEAVVQAQLAALKCEDTASVFAFASPSNQAATGPLERFDSLLRNPMYRPLLSHRTAEPYRRKMLAPESYSEVVKVISDNTGLPQRVEMVYLWELHRQGPGAGVYAGCWMVDGVSLVAAKALN